MRKSPTSQLSAALAELDRLIATERAGLEADRPALDTLVALRDGLGRAKPGQAPDAQTLSLVRRFFDEQLGREEKRLREAPLPTGAASARAAVVSALAAARAAVQALEPRAGALAAASAALNLQGAVARGQAAVSSARGHLALPVLGRRAS